ncbi:hypothetical protein P43SY_006929 [Pythium insidiosum]|uniref:Uncharacterized protein n=1 Tax=Pythium insidiosum TaxID=114742 RepID=A0AAD5Q8Y4_PYTIN|nr:hypothetical protein P43SY_006929 [Pythium insidiosum]
MPYLRRSHGRLSALLALVIAVLLVADSTLTPTAVALADAVPSQLRGDSAPANAVVLRALAANSSSRSGAAPHAGAASNASAEQKHDQTEEHAAGPSTSSFFGPLIAGTLAILVIGAVIVFKQYQASRTT